MSVKVESRDKEHLQGFGIVLLLLLQLSMANRTSSEYFKFNYNLVCLTLMLNRLHSDLDKCSCYSYYNYGLKA